LAFLSVIFAPLNLPTIGAWPIIAALFFYSLLPIIRNSALMLEGAIPAALMALAVKGLCAGLEKRLAPQGLDAQRRERGRER
jgi:ABC-type proline/glycine betaine transport system permease subunit